MFLSLVDLSMRPMSPEGNILSVRTTCTNRDLPVRLPFGRRGRGFRTRGRCGARNELSRLRKPTPAVRPASGKGALWRLISHLSLNYLSLVEDGKDALQQILRLYDIGRTAYSQNVIDSVVSVRSSPSFRPRALGQRNDFCARNPGGTGTRRGSVCWRRSLPVCRA